MEELNIHMFYLVTDGARQWDWHSGFRVRLPGTHGNHFAFRRHLCRLQPGEIVESPNGGSGTVCDVHYIGQHDRRNGADSRQSCPFEMILANPVPNRQNRSWGTDCQGNGRDDKCSQELVTRCVCPTGIRDYTHIQLSYAQVIHIIPEDKYGTCTPAYVAKSQRLSHEPVLSREKHTALPRAHV